MFSAWGPAGTVVRARWGWGGFGKVCALMERMGGAGWPLSSFEQMAEEILGDEMDEILDTLAECRAIVKWITPGMVWVGPGHIDDVPYTNGKNPSKVRAGRAGAAKRWHESANSSCYNSANSTCYDSAIAKDTGRDGRKLEIASGSIDFSQVGGPPGAIPSAITSAISSAINPAISAMGGMRGGTPVQEISTLVEEKNYTSTDPNASSTKVTSTPVKTAKRTREQRIKELTSLPFPITLETPECHKAWEDWIDYQASPGRLKFLYNRPKDAARVLEKWMHLGADRFIAALNHSQGQNWQSALIREPDQGRGPTSVYERNREQMRRNERTFQEDAT